MTDTVARLERSGRDTFIQVPFKLTNIEHGKGKRSEIVVDDLRRARFKPNGQTY